MAAKETKTEAVVTKKPTTAKATTKKAAAPEKETAATKKPTTPKATTKKAAAPEITQEMIAERAYHISQSEEGGTDEENWHRGEAELWQGANTGVDEEERQALWAEGFDPDDPCVCAAIDFVWELSMPPSGLAASARCSREAPGSELGSRRRCGYLCHPRCPSRFVTRRSGRR